MFEADKALGIIIIIIIIIHTPKNLGAKKIERERDKEGQWTAGMFSVANRGLLVCPPTHTNNRGDERTLVTRYIYRK